MKAEIENAKTIALAAQQEQIKLETIQASKLAKNEVEMQLLTTLLTNKISFGYNSSDLTPRSQKNLDKIVGIIKNHDNLYFEIQGHMDAYGNEDHNIQLTQERADAVKAYLVLNGIDEQILNTRGVGSAEPIADNQTNEGRLQNRRIVIKIVE